MSRYASHKCIVCGQDMRLENRNKKYCSPLCKKIATIKKQIKEIIKEVDFNYDVWH